MSNNQHQQDQPTLWDEPPRQPRSSKASHRRTAKGASPPRPTNQPMPISSSGPTSTAKPEEVSSGPIGERLWTAADVAAYLGVPVKTIHAWRSQGRGPKGFRAGKHLRWRAATVFDWSLDQERTQ